MAPTDQKRILVVDDEEQVRTLLCNLLEREGFAVSAAASGADMRRMLDCAPLSLITLDLNLAGEDGLAIAREVRAKRDVPIIMITAKAGEIDRVVGLELGADDYIVKPFNLREVLARIRAVLRRYEAPLGTPAPSAAPTAGQERLSFGEWTLNPASRELRKRNGESVELTTAEYNLLELLVRRPGRVLSRDTIMDLLKGHDWSPLDRSIDTLVGRLRRKIETDVDTPRIIKTVRGIGYVLAEEVSRA